MAGRQVARSSVATHVVPVDAPHQPSRPARPRHLAAVSETQPRRSAEVVDIASRRAAQRPKAILRPEGEPAVLARWAVFLAVIMLVAAATSGQA